MALGTHEREILAVMDRFWSAFEAQDYPGMADSFTDDGIMWFCSTNEERPAAEIISEKQVRGTRARYHVLRSYVIGADCLQQVVVEVSTPSGPYEVPVFARSVLHDGRISRFEEYWDSGRAAQMAALLGGTGPEWDSLLKGAQPPTRGRTQ